MDQVSIEDQMLINNQNININILDQVSTKDQMSIDNQNLNVNIVNTSKKWQILFVEDNNDMRYVYFLIHYIIFLINCSYYLYHVYSDYLMDLLKKFDVHHAHDGKDALRVLKKLIVLPDLILSSK